MSESKVGYGTEAEQWAADAQELRGLLESAGLTQSAAGREMELSERAIRGYCSGREAVPRAVMLAAKWLAQHEPNTDRWLQVHWKVANIKVSGGDKFDLQLDGPQLVFLVNQEVKIRGKLDDLVKAGVLSLHTSYSSDRFRLPVTRPYAQRVELDEDAGQFGLRLITKGKDDYPLAPSVQFFTRDGRVQLSPQLMTWVEIEHACQALHRNVDALETNAKRTMSEAGAS